MRKSYHTIFFDVGGTLIKAKPSVGAVYAEVAALYGIQLEAGEVERAARRAFGELLARNRVGGGTPHSVSLEAARAWWREVVRRSLGDAARTPRFEAYYQRVFQEFARPERYELFPDAERVLRELEHAGYRLGIISNWDPRLRPILEGLRLAQKFRTIVISGETGCEKPDPAIYTLARRQALESGGGESADARFLLVGDSPLEDRDGAIAAGFEARLVRRESGETLGTILHDLLP